VSPPGFSPVLGAVGQPTGPAFDLVLLAHVLAVAVSVGTVGVSGIQAFRLSRVPTGSGPRATLENYYAPGTNWAGRLLFAVPLLGLALVGMSHGYYHFSDDWILQGIALWVVAAMLAEGVLWPAERQIQELVHSMVVDGGADQGARVDPLAATCRRAWCCAAALVVILVLATVLMVAQP